MFFADTVQLLSLISCWKVLQKYAKLGKSTDEMKLGRCIQRKESISGPFSANSTKKPNSNSIIYPYWSVQPVSADNSLAEKTFTQNSFISFGDPCWWNPHKNQANHNNHKRRVIRRMSKPANRVQLELTISAPHCKRINDFKGMWHYL